MDFLWILSMIIIPLLMYEFILAFHVLSIVKLHCLNDPLILSVIK